MEAIVSERDDERPLSEDVDLEAWDAAPPPRDFSERVVERIRAERSDGQGAAPKGRRFGSRATAVVIAASLAASVALAFRSPAPARGSAIARDRIELTMGSRARVVLEPGAELAWDGDDVVQSRGDVFYRVEPGARFRVKTPAGVIEVKGTCFGVRVAEMQKRDIKVAAAGAGAAALVLLGVYEGKVALSHDGQRAELGAGEAATFGGGRVERQSLADGQKAFDAKVAARGDEPLEAANQNLVNQVTDYKKRLEALSAQKVELEGKLSSTERALAAAQADGSAPRVKHDFDLSQDDWKELAKDGTVKARTPCIKPEGWAPSAEQLQRLGLAPDDAATLKTAYAQSNERIWAALRPLCAQAVNSAEVAEKLGPSTCQHLVLDVEGAKDGDATNEAMRLVGEIRSGARPMPGPGEKLHPVAKMFLAVTHEPKAFEDELARAFGPEEAHRIAYSDELCMSRSTWGRGPRKGK